MVIKMFEKKKEIEASKGLSQKDLFIEEKLKGLDEKFNELLDLMHGDNFINTYTTSVSTVKIPLRFKQDTNNIPINEITVTSIGGVLTLYLNNASIGIIAAAGNNFSGEFYSIEYTQATAASALILQTRIRR